MIKGTTLAGIWFNGPAGPNTARDNLITAGEGEGIRVEEQADRHRLEATSFSATRRAASRCAAPTT